MQTSASPTLSQSKSIIIYATSSLNFIDDYVRAIHSSTKYKCSNIIKYTILYDELESIKNWNHRFAHKIIRYPNKSPHHIKQSIIVMSSTTTKSSSARTALSGETYNIVNIIPRWSDLNSKLFTAQSTTKLPKRISITHLPSYDVSTSTITKQTKAIERRRTSKATTTKSKVKRIGITNSSVASTHLGSKLAGDALVAVAVTFVVSPFLTVVDKAIVESAAGTNSILSSSLNSFKSMARNPIEYIRSPTFLLMWCVYSATYTTANAFKTLEEYSTYSRDRSSSSSIDHQKSSSISNNNGMFKLGAFFGTTFINSGASLVKDKAYARMFSGSSTSTKSFPRSTYALWMMRDFSVIGSSFLLPDIVSPKLVEHYGMDNERARSLCQFGLPVLAQFVASPFQYLGLDMYNRTLTELTTSQAAIDRSRKLYKGIVPVIAARIARIIPGYSIGGVANTKLRTAWRENLLQRDVEAMMKNKQNNNNYYATRLVALLHGSGGDSQKTNNMP